MRITSLSLGLCGAPTVTCDLSAGFKAGFLSVVVLKSPPYMPRGIAPCRAHDPPQLPIYTIPTSTLYPSVIQPWLAS